MLLTEYDEQAVMQAIAKDSRLSPAIFPFHLII